MGWIIIWISILKTWGVLYRRNLLTWLTEAFQIIFDPGELDICTLSPKTVLWETSPDFSLGRSCSISTLSWSGARPPTEAMLLGLNMLRGSLFLPFPHRRNEAIESIRHGTYSYHWPWWMWAMSSVWKLLTVFNQQHFNSGTRKFSLSFQRAGLSTLLDSMSNTNMWPKRDHVLLQASEFTYWTIYSDASAYVSFPFLPTLLFLIGTHLIRPTPTPRPGR